MSVNVLGKTFELALLRAGPQDFPFMPNRHALFGVVGGTPVFMVYSLALSPVIALSMALGTVLGIFLATRLILRWRKLDGRFAQTAHALMCTNALLTVLMILPFSQIAPLLSELAANSCNEHLYKKPVELEFEKVMYPFMLFTKNDTHTSNGSIQIKATTSTQRVSTSLDATYALTSKTSAKSCSTLFSTKEISIKQKNSQKKP